MAGSRSAASSRALYLVSPCLCGPPTILLSNTARSRRGVRGLRGEGQIEQDERTDPSASRSQQPSNLSASVRAAFAPAGNAPVPKPCDGFGCPCRRPGIQPRRSVRGAWRADGAAQGFAHRWSSGFGPVPGRGQSSGISTSPVMCGNRWSSRSPTVALQVVLVSQPPVQPPGCRRRSKGVTAPAGSPE